MEYSVHIYSRKYSEISFIIHPASFNIRQHLQRLDLHFHTAIPPFPDTIPDMHS